MVSKMGGRKFVLALLATLCVAIVMPLLEAPGNAYSSLAVIVVAFAGGNAAIEWKHASESKNTAREGDFEPTP